MSDYNIMIIDDDPLLVKALALRLETMGARVTSACDAATGVMLAQVHPPDLVVLDMNMPDHNGLIVHQNLARLARTASIPILYLTGDRTPDAKQKAMELGAYAVLYKPFDANELFNVIKRILTIVPRRVA